MKNSFDKCDLKDGKCKREYLRHTLGRINEGSGVPKNPLGLLRWCALTSGDDAQPLHPLPPFIIRNSATLYFISLSMMIPIHAFCWFRHCHPEAGNMNTGTGTTLFSPQNTTFRCFSGSCEVKTKSANLSPPAPTGMLKTEKFLHFSLSF